MMSRIGFLPAGVAILALTACATSAPVATPAPAPQAASTATAEPDDKPAKLYTDGYRLVKRNGQELYCKSEPVSGSRTRTFESCLTYAQLQARDQNTEKLLRDMNDTPGSKTGSDGSGGRTNTLGH